MSDQALQSTKHIPQYFQKRYERFNIKLPNVLREKFKEPCDIFLLNLLQTSMHIKTLPDMDNYTKRIHSMAGRGGQRWTLWLSRDLRDLFVQRKEEIGSRYTHAEFIELLIVLKELIESETPLAPSTNLSNQQLLISTPQEQLVAGSFGNVSGLLGQEMQLDNNAPTMTVSVSEIFGTPEPPEFIDTSNLNAENAASMQSETSPFSLNDLLSDSLNAIGMNPTPLSLLAEPSHGLYTAQFVPPPNSNTMAIDDTIMDDILSPLVGLFGSESQFLAQTNLSPTLIIGSQSPDRNKQHSQRAVASVLPSALAHSRHTSAPYAHSSAKRSKDLSSPLGAERFSQPTSNTWLMPLAPAPPSGQNVDMLYSQLWQDVDIPSLINQPITNPLTQPFQHNQMISQPSVFSALIPMETMLVSAGLYQTNNQPFGSTQPAFKVGSTPMQPAFQTDAYASSAMADTFTPQPQDSFNHLGLDVDLSSLWSLNTQHVSHTMPMNLQYTPVNVGPSIQTAARSQLGSRYINANYIPRSLSAFPQEPDPNLQTFIAKYPMGYNTAGTQ
ncbi:hypothetical protein RTP6_003667 [Batrachochytrium dendrobatidis]